MVSKKYTTKYTSGSPTWSHCAYGYIFQDSLDNVVYFVVKCILCDVKTIATF